MHLRLITYMKYTNLFIFFIVGDYKLPIVVRNSNDFIVRNETDVDGVCISIPEDSYTESFLGNFLAFIDGKY